MPPLAIMGAIGAAGSIASSAIGANAAGNAADAQSQAAIQAAQIQANQANKGLDFQKQVFGTQQSELAPYLSTGYSGLANLANLMGVLPTTNVPLNIPGVTGSPTAGFPSGLTLGPNGQPISSQGIPTAANPTGQPLSASDFKIAPGQQGPIALPGGRFGVTRGGGVVNDGREGGPGALVPRPRVTSATPPQLTLQSLVNPSLGASGSLAKGFDEKFVAPTGATEQNDPGYKFRLDQGMQALERSASASGNLFTGGTGKELARYGQDYASNEYGNVYNRAFNEFSNRYNIFENNQTNLYNRLASMSGIGQQTASQLGYLGNQAAGNATNLLLGSGQQIGNDLQNAAAARASGYVGGANAISGGINSITGGIGNLLLMKQLLGKSGSGGGSGSGLMYDDNGNII